MKKAHVQKIFLFLYIAVLLTPGLGWAQERDRLAESPVLKTPLPAETLNLLANEISGRLIFNNLVKLAGAPWLRDEKEFTDTFYESGKIYEIVRS